MENPCTKAMIQIIATALGELNENAVFVGGATIPFYLPDAYLAQTRPTEDIDVIMKIIGRNENASNDEKLRAKGFQHDQRDNAPACRWIYENLIVDIVSTDSSASGFTNKWYKEGIEYSIKIIKDPVSVKILSLPYFIATKIEAFKGRGENSYMASSDMEDIISILEVSPSDLFEDIINECSSNLKNYLKQEFQVLLNSSGFEDALPGAVFNRNNTSLAVQAVKDRMGKFLALV